MQGKEPGSLSFLASTTYGGSCYGAAASRLEGLGVGVRLDTFLTLSLLIYKMGKSIIIVSAQVMLQTQGS